MICPIEFRYGREDMKRIFSKQRRFEGMLDVEVALAYAHFRMGNICERDFRTMEASKSSVSMGRAEEIEQETKHDVMAMVRAFSEACGDGGRYTHMGATSNDITDSATAMQMRDAMRLIETDLKSLAEALASKAEKHANTLCLARTHGQAALPTTFGYKLTTFGFEFLRHLERLGESHDRICVGKLMGAVGTGAGFGKKAIEIEAIAMERLGLGCDEAPTQVVGRDRYVELISILSNIATSLEKLATEIRNLQRSELGEVFEPFDTENQVGSSTMAHKRNPIISENVCGLCRIVRGFLIPMHESAILWHERDLTNSSAERFILPHTFILLDDSIIKMTGVIEKMCVDEKKMKRNLEAAGREIMAESLMLALTHKGMSRQDAHEILRKAAMEDFEKVFTYERITDLMSREEIDEALDYRGYTGVAVEKTMRFVMGVENGA